MKATLGSILVNDALPEELRDYSRVWDKKTTQAVLDVMARKYPDRYKDVVDKLHTIGGLSAYVSGHSVSLQDVQGATISRSKNLTLRRAIDRINDQRGSLTGRNSAILKLLGAVAEESQANTLDQLAKAGNPLAKEVLAGARGNATQLNSMVGSAVLMLDQNDNPAPIPVANSLAQGLTPAEYWAQSYGTRKGAIATKKGTAEAGYLSKQLALAAHKLLASDDELRPGVGLPVDADDVDNVGTVLAANVGDMKAGTVITPSMMKRWPKGTKKILVRSPISDIARNGGIPREALGLRERGTFPDVGEQVGIPAIQTITERLSQGSLNVKHCITCYTPVLYADWSSRRIDEVQEGDWVMGSDATGRLRPVQVLEVIDNGPKQCWRTTFIRNGAHRRKAEEVRLDSTLDHKLLATRYVTGQKDEVLNGQLRQIHVGQKSRQFYAALPAGFDSDGLRQEPMALLLGLLLGDGCYTEAVGSVHFSTADEQLKQELTQYLLSLNLKFTKLAGHKYYHRVSMIDDPGGDRNSDGRMKTGSRNPARKFLEEHGMWGKYAYEKVIPDVVHTWDNQSVASLLAGLVITDGSIYPSDSHRKPGISFVSTSRQMIDQFRYLSGIRFGLWFTEPTRVQEVSIRGEWRHNHEMWQITLTVPSQVRKFAELVPLKGVKRDYLRRLIDDYQSPDREAFVGFKRVRQEPLGELLTFDLQVDHPDHLFVLANGLIVSNSGGAGGVRRGGFPVINQLLQVPKVFPSGAAHSVVDGTVAGITEAPQGGKYIWIGEEKYYVSQEQEPTVKVGDRVEEGDVLSNGLPNPAIITKYKGIGEGRKYFMELMRDVLEESRMSTNRRNIEVLARSVINHVEVMDDSEAIPGAMPGDVVEYDRLAAIYQPREGTIEIPSKSVKQGYLEQPVLQYSIGTRITPKVRETFKRFGVGNVAIHPDPPPFQPAMSPVLTNLAKSPDWLERLGSFYVSRGFLDSVHRGASSDLESTSYIPRVIAGKPLSGLGK